MPNSNGSFLHTLPRDLTAGVVVFLVALPLCLGIALASGAPLFSGLLAGIVGGIVVGLLSGSHTSVSGPAAGLTAVVAAQLATLGSFQTFLLALFFAGLIQIALGLARAGSLSAFFPSSVIKGLLAAIGIILILKQIPHVVGHDADAEGDFSFLQMDSENTFSELLTLFKNFHAGAAVIGLSSVILLIVWDQWKRLKKSPIPSPLVIVGLGIGLHLLFQRLGSPWAIETSHMVQVPVAEDFAGFLNFLQLPNFAAITNTQVYIAAFTLAAVASLETLLNLEAVDKLDPKQRTSPGSRELVAQGVGNTVASLIGGLPITSVIVRGSVNISYGSQTKFSAIFHGLLLLSAIMFMPTWLNMIPLSCLAAILLVTGIKLASPALFRQMARQGSNRFAPFLVTVLAIVFTDLLIGVLIGLVVSLAFILISNVKRPIRRIVEKHLGGEVVHIELANQVSFLNRAALAQALDEVPRGGQLLLDARHTDYIDPDILDLFRDFKEVTAPARRIEISLLGFRDRYDLQDQTQYVDYSTREIQDAITPEQVLQLLKEGNERFRTGRQLTRDLGRQVNATASGQHPLAVVVSCIDSRSPIELIFDTGVGDIFGVRIAGNVLSRKVLASTEYGTAVAGAKLILIMGHTRCGAVGAAVNLMDAGKPVAEITGCQHLDHLTQEIQHSIDEAAYRGFRSLSPADQEEFTNEVARRHVARTVEHMLKSSDTLARLVTEGRIAIVGAMYNVSTGSVEFFNHTYEALPRLEV